MRIALVSFEFPPAIAIGGIGTYAWEAATMLAQGGHKVEVFSAGKKGPEPAEEFGIKVHRFDADDRAAFRKAIVPTFSQCHKEAPFDVLESPELGMEGQEIAKKFPDLPRVVKLHTPEYLLGQIGWEEPTLLEKLHFTLGCLRKGKLAFLEKPPFEPESDPECLWTRKADEIAAPSSAIGNRLAEDWFLDREKISFFPLPMTPSAELLSLEPATEAKTIGFLGRLEPRKGVLEMARAIPSILRKAPETRFRFIGPTWNYKQSDMETWIRKNFASSLHAIDFVGAIGKEQLADEFKKCDVMLFPSRWESFGLVCPESMSAARAVIGSSSGGMAEIIVNGESGILVPPKDPQAIAKAVLNLINRPERVTTLAKNGRQRVLDFLSHEGILPLQIASYERAISAAKKRNA